MQQHYPPDTIIINGATSQEIAPFIIHRSVLFYYLQTLSNRIFAFMRLFLLLKSFGKLCDAMPFHKRC